MQGRRGVRGDGVRNKELRYEEEDREEGEQEEDREEEIIPLMTSGGQRSTAGFFLPFHGTHVVQAKIEQHLVQER